MDPVSNAGRIAMLLRQRLQERSRSAGAERGGRKESTSAGAAAAKGSLRGAAAIDALDDGKLKRALIENILADQFGAALINDARFQQMVDQVTETLEADGDGARLLAGAIAGLRSSPA